MPITGVVTNKRSPWIAVRVASFYMFAVKIGRHRYSLSLYRGKGPYVRLGLTRQHPGRRHSFFPFLFEHVSDLHAGKQLLRHVASDKFVSMSGARGRYVLPRLVTDRRYASAFSLTLAN